MLRACEWCVASVLENEAERRQSTNRRIFFFYASNFWGGSQADESDNYAWAPDTVKMSFDPGHSACRRVSEINIFSSGFRNSWGRSQCQWCRTPWNVAHATPKCLLRWEEKSPYKRKAPRLGRRVSKPSVPLFPEKLRGQQRALVDSCAERYLTQHHSVIGKCQSCYQMRAEGHMAESTFDVASAHGSCSSGYTLFYILSAKLSTNRL